MLITIIAAVARNHVISYQNRLLYWLPSDLKRFKAFTIGYTVIMGRRTFESLPRGALPDRRNIVLSRTQAHFDGCDSFVSPDEILVHCATDEDIYIIGGAHVRQQAIEWADRLYLTEVDDVPEHVDAFFPPYDDWHEIPREEHDTDERHVHRYAFVNYVKGKQGTS